MSPRRSVATLLCFVEHSTPDCNQSNSSSVGTGESNKTADGGLTFATVNDCGLPAGIKRNSQDPNRASVLKYCSRRRMMYQARSHTKCDEINMLATHTDAHFSWFARPLALSLSHRLPQPPVTCSPRFPVSRLWSRLVTSSQSHPAGRLVTTPRSLSVSRTLAWCPPGTCLVCLSFLSPPFFSPVRSKAGDGFVFFFPPA